jgi:hypothetical protein
MKLRIFTYLLLTALLLLSCKSNDKVIEKLSDKDKKFLVTAIEKMLDKDKKYRSIAALGTLNDSIIELDKKLSETATFEEYVAFTQSIQKTLTDKQTDSLWNLQYQNDYENYTELKKIIKKYGYPSEDRIGTNVDVFTILLHPPGTMNPQKYLDEMVKLLKPEVIAKRMSGQFFAMFFDNITHKILKKPQFYGTGKEFDSKTMTMGNPTIVDIIKTNKARKEIGLPELKEGEYRLAK